MSENTFQIRVTGVLVKGDNILLVKQAMSNGREWSLPGGRVERGELLGEALAPREIKEETGLDVEVGRLLYVCDKPDAHPPLLHITFQIKCIFGDITLPSNIHDTNPISDVRFIRVADLCEYGFFVRFEELVKADFPKAGTYQGLKESIGLG